MYKMDIKDPLFLSILLDDKLLRGLTIWFKFFFDWLKAGYVVV